MANFLPAFGHILILEGGYVNDPDDPGGETKYGITKRDHPDLDIAGLTLDEAHDIYLNEYWKVLRLSSIGSQAIANEIMEQGIHIGPFAAAEIAQKAISLLGDKVAVDGAIGPQTANAINRFRFDDALLKVLNSYQLDHYRRLVERKPVMAKYIRGWLRRITL